MTVQDFAVGSELDRVLEITTDATVAQADGDFVKAAGLWRRAARKVTRSDQRECYLRCAAKCERKAV